MAPQPQGTQGTEGDGPEWSPLGMRTWTQAGWTVPELLEDGPRVSLHPLSLQPWAQAPATHPGAEVNLEDGAIAAPAEHVMLSQVHGHSHDAHIKEHRQQQLARGDLP